MRPLDAFLDNPILVKHLRSRLRLAQALPWVVVVLVLCVLDVWASLAVAEFRGSGATTALLGLQILLLVFAGSSQINASLGGARETGILDFHRVSPLPPAATALGFLLGAPIREYILAAITVPFALAQASQIDVFKPWAGVRDTVTLEVVILTSVLVVHTMTLLGCLTRKKPRGSIRGTVITVVLLVIFGPYMGISLFFGARWVLGAGRTMSFSGLDVPWELFTLLYQVPVLGFLFLAASRKMHSEREHAYSKPQALSFMATVTALVIAGLWHVGRQVGAAAMFGPAGQAVLPQASLVLVSVYGLSAVAMVLSATITPDGSEYVRGVLRAEHAGRRRPSPWSDAGSNRIAVLALCGLVLVGTLAVTRFVGFPAGGGADPWANPGQDFGAANLQPQLEQACSRPIAIAVLCVAYVGLGLQYFMMRARRSGMTLMGLFLFLAWLVPLLAAAILGVTSGEGKVAAVVAALSPFFGIAMSTNLYRPENADMIQLSALAPPITFAMVFNYLLVVVQRKLDRMVHAKIPKPELDLGLAEVPGAL